MLFRNLSTDVSGVEADADADPAESGFFFGAMVKSSFLVTYLE